MYRWKNLRMGKLVEAGVQVDRASVYSLSHADHIATPHRRTALKSGALPVDRSGQQVKKGEGSHA
jgi:hypothetical protein